MSATASALPNPPRLVEYEQLRFLVFEEPSDELLPLFIKEFTKYGVQHIVSACAICYDKAALESKGYIHHELKFTDGAAPPDDVITEWIELVFSVFGKDEGVKATQAIGVHCAAGLGRAPVLVAIAMIEQGAEPLEAVSLIREKCPGAINTPQIRFLQNYKRRNKSKCNIC
ncbi:phosphatases II [Pelomyxa schiedti]|nr:phosphatases II [Pelomyxa schiedti]